MTHDVPPRLPADRPEALPATGATPAGPAPTARQPYQPPTLTTVGRLEALTRGSGSTWTDYLGDTKTRYG